MRRSHRPLLGLVLIASGLPAAIAVSGALTLLLRPLTHVALDWGAISPVGLGAVVVIAAAVAEVGWVFRSRPRPWAVSRQVPQSWGHEHGPWKAALRYGARLGVGPATVLTSWSWWAGAVVGAVSGWVAWATFSAVFVVVRAVLTIALPGNPLDGIELAQRMARLRNADASSGYLALGAMALSCILIGVAA